MIKLREMTGAVVEKQSIKAVRYIGVIIFVPSTVKYNIFFDHSSEDI